VLHAAGAATGETAMAAVDPRYRGRRLFERMKETMGNLARMRGLYGLYSEAVAVHTFTQQGNLALGGFETGFLLGFTPATQVFRKITDGANADRRAAVLFYLRTNPEAARDVHVPPHHHDMIASVVARGGMNRRQLPPAPELSLRSLHGRVTALDLAARPDVGRAFLTVHGYGEDVLQLVLSELRDLCRHGYACIYLELPLADPMTATLCRGFESFGFFFAGVLFEAGGGDVLRLQYLNGVTVRADEIQVASDFGRDLLAYVLAAQDAVARARVERRRQVLPAAVNVSRRRSDRVIAERAAVRDHSVRDHNIAREPGANAP
jgi:serine/threonine-protein kinase RsbW